MRVEGLHRPVTVEAPKEGKQKPKWSCLLHSVSHCRQATLTDQEGELSAKNHSRKFNPLKETQLREEFRHEERENPYNKNTLLNRGVCEKSIT